MFHIFKFTDLAGPAATENLARGVQWAVVIGEQGDLLKFGLWTFIVTLTESKGSQKAREMPQPSFRGGEVNSGGPIAVASK